MEINTPVGDIVVSTDPERFVFDVDQVFKGEAQTRQSVVTAREGASCGLEISGPGPFVVLARPDDDGITRGAVDGEVYSSLCSGTRPLADGELPTSFGTPSSPVTVEATGEASSSRASSANGSSAPGLWIAAITGVLVLGTGGAAPPHGAREHVWYAAVGSFHRRGIAEEAVDAFEQDSGRTDSRDVEAWCGA